MEPRPAALYVRGVPRLLLVAASPRYHIWHRGIAPLAVAATLLSLSSGCANSPATPDAKNYDVTVVDRSDPEHVTVEYDGHCALSVARGEAGHVGSSDYQLKLGDKTYYFGSARARDEFKADLDRNLQAADREWQHEHQMGSASRGGAG